MTDGSNSNNARYIFCDNQVENRYTAGHMGTMYLFLLLTKLTGLTGLQAV